MPLSLHPFQSSSKKSQRVLSHYERAYASEFSNNFRSISRSFATKSTYVLTEADRVQDEATYAFLYDISQYAEIAHGLVSVNFIFKNIDELCQPGFPLDGYNALRDDKAILIQSFNGAVANLQAYVALRPHTGQLVVTFSGTSNLTQIWKDLQACKVAYPRDRTALARVHRGFWSMYCGVRPKVLEAIQLGFAQHSSQISSVVVTGHSMGTTMCYLLALDLMADLHSLITVSDYNQQINLPNISLVLAVFGAPRLGNEGFAQFWRNSVQEYRRRFGQDSFREYSLKAFSDGVHVLPPYSMGYRHLTELPLYLYHGQLYQIPRTECEHGAFTVIQSEIASEQDRPHDTRELFSPRQSISAVSYHSGATDVGSRPERLIWPRGGHNYYFRDMENLGRRIYWLELGSRGEENWRERYKYRLKKWEAKYGHAQDSVRTRGRIANYGRSTGEEEEELISL